eukprot:CAMPEP_0115655558 /NCGR_PEP_ID=MMETSP0272-20121206/43699_1 /TAXON_ID=71861 /ORGANISM="Scrippsiella trochoidea, Strain CCMP3099" /LENGTH=239 /DNA_ID=CAMNT_0003093503 /DNA_START=25 /DNA_END=744 /DNA_ORIENTATION=+
MKEYRAQGAEVMGCMQQGAEDITFGEGFLNANSVISQQWRMHALVILALCMNLTFGIMYQGLLGDLGEMLFGSAAAGEILASILPITSGIGGCIVVPSFAFASDYFNAGSMALLAGTVMLSVLTSIFLVQTTWLAQVFTCVCFGVMNSLLATYLTRYLLAFSGQARLGIVNGLCNTYASLLSLLTQSSLYAWISLFPNPSTPAMQTILPLEVASVATSSVLVVFSSCIAIMGLPDKPVK